MNHPVNSRGGLFVLAPGGVLLTFLALASGCERPPPPGVDGDEPAVPSEFGCGEASCSVTHQYCEVIIPGDRLPFEDPDVNISRACRPLPAACLAEPSCECLHEETGLDAAEASCNRSAQGGLTLSRRPARTTPCSDGGAAPCTGITPRR